MILDHGQRAPTSRGNRHGAEVRNRGPRVRLEDCCQWELSAHLRPQLRSATVDHQDLEVDVRALTFQRRETPDEILPTVDRGYDDAQCRLSHHWSCGSLGTAPGLEGTRPLRRRTTR